MENKSANITKAIVVFSRKSSSVFSIRRQKRAKVSEGGEGGGTKPFVWTLTSPRSKQCDEFCIRREKLIQNMCLNIGAVD